MAESSSSPSSVRSGHFISQSRTRARAEVRAALRARELINPGVCENCKRCLKVEAHHDDYSKPLNIRWLCRRCHLGWHADNGPGKDTMKRPPASDCALCGRPLSPGARPNAKYCSSTCRRESYRDRHSRGLVASVRCLKSGKKSVVVYMDDTLLRPGQLVKVAEIED